MGGLGMTSWLHHSYIIVHACVGGGIEDEDYEAQVTRQWPVT